MHLLRHSQPRYFGAADHRGTSSRRHRNALMVLVGKHLTEPTHRAGQVQVPRPSTLIATLVSSPAKTAPHPARTPNGHAVGAGITTLAGTRRCSIGIVADLSSPPFFHLARDEIHHRENHHPDCIDKVPIHREDSDTFRVLALHEPQSGEHHDDRQPGEADDDVKGMQADQGVKRSSEEVGADRQAVVVDQSATIPRAVPG